MDIEKWGKIKICGMHKFSVILIYFTLNIVFYIIFFREFQLLAFAFDDSLSLDQDTVGNWTEFPTCEKQKNRENTRQRKTITRTRQYLCGSAICLRPWSCRDFTIIRKEYKVRLQYFLSIKNTATTPTIKP